jgi:hypothetical protein
VPILAKPFGVDILTKKVREVLSATAAGVASPFAGAYR